VTAPGRFGADQRGATLIIGLVMLILVTMLTLAGLKMGKADTEIVANSQQRMQAMAAAQAAIEQVTSRPQFTQTPADAIATACVEAGVRLPNTVCIDFYGDGVAKVKVTVTPTCAQAKPIPNASLDLTQADDAACSLGVSQSFGIAGASNNNSMCAAALWDLQSVASDPIGGAKASINQGVSIRQAATTACP
jgi:Tfp pilus assembly protein PilX